MFSRRSHRSQAHVPLSRFSARFAATAKGPVAPGRRLALWLALPGLVALTVEPALWLWRSWQDPSYQSDGMIVALVTAGLLVVSVSSGSAPPDPRDRRRATIALALTACVRLAGRLLAVHTVGALALVVDVFAVATLLGVRRRPFALEPGFVGLFFVLALPLEHLAQRLLGHPLQLLSATAAELVLAPFFPALTREGVLLLHPAVELAVDLPCSGARGLVLLTAIGLGGFTRLAPGVRGAAAAALAVLVGAFAANTLRIVGLFVGGAHGLPIIFEPWHSLLGAGVLALGAVPLLAILLRAEPRRATRPPLSLGFVSHRRPAHRYTWLTSWPAALGVSVVGVAVAHAPARPLDVSPSTQTLRLPTTLGAFDGFDVPLEPREVAYFTQWGGFAQKRIYDDGRGEPMTALLVRTRSPLRHLHGPEACLVGSGHRVTRMGVVPRATPAVLYRSVAPDGRVWRIEASFVSDKGAWATSVSEVVWRFMEDPEDTWSLVERITPWTTCEASPERCHAFEGALFASLDLPAENPR